MLDRYRSDIGNRYCLVPARERQEEKPDFVRSKQRLTSPRCTGAHSIGPRESREHCSRGRRQRNEFQRDPRAGDGTRTHDVQLGKLAFYH